MALLFEKQLFFFILGSCRSEEFYSTTSEHSHVKMSAAGGLSQRQPRQIKHTRESEVIVTAGSAAKIKASLTQMVRSKQRPNFDSVYTDSQPLAQLCNYFPTDCEGNEIFITCTPINYFSASLLVCWAD